MGVIKALWIHKIDFYSTGYFPRCICVDLWAENSQVRRIGTYIRHIRVFLRSRNAQMKLKKSLFHLKCHKRNELLVRKSWLNGLMLQSVNTLLL